MTRYGVLLVVGCLLLGAVQAQAELYLAGQVGTSLTNDFSDVHGTGQANGITASNLKLSDSVLYGGKLGYYFDGVKWLGVETEAYTNTPGTAQQRVTLRLGNSTASAVVPGVSARVTTWAFNALARYPGEYIQPYGGVGVGIFFASAGGASDTAVGLNALAGVRYKLSQSLSIFGEYKYNRATFNFAVLPNAGLQGDYATNIVVGGVAVHF